MTYVTDVYLPNVLVGDAGSRLRGHSAIAVSSDHAIDCAGGQTGQRGGFAIGVVEGDGIRANLNIGVSRSHILLNREIDRARNVSGSGDRNGHLAISSIIRQNNRAQGTSGDFLFLAGLVVADIDSGHEAILVVGHDQGSGAVDLDISVVAESVEGGGGDGGVYYDMQISEKSWEVKNSRPAQKRGTAVFE